MAEFNAMDTAAFKAVWVFCEQREGEIQSISYQLLSEGRKLANDLGVELAGVVMGSGLAEADLKTLGGYGADRVYNIDSPLLKDYTTDGYAKALCDLIMDKKPEIMLIGATNLGRDLGPRCAARLHTGLTADCTHLDVDVEKYKNFLRTTSNIDVDNTKFEENTNLKMTRPAFGGHLMATIICPRFRPQMSTVRPGVMQMQAFDQAGADKVVVENVTPALTADDIHVQVLDIKKSAEKLVDLIGADVVVAVGRGISAVCRPPGRSDRQDRASPHLRCTGHLRCHPARCRYAGFREHHRHQQERERPHLRCCHLRHRRRSVQGRSRADQGDQGCQGLIPPVINKSRAPQRARLFVFLYRSVCHSRGG